MGVANTEVNCTRFWPWRHRTFPIFGQTVLLKYEQANIQTYHPRGGTKTQQTQQTQQTTDATRLLVVRVFLLVAGQPDSNISTQSRIINVFAPRRCVVFYTTPCLVKCFSTMRNDVQHNGDRCTGTVFLYERCKQRCTDYRSAADLDACQDNANKR